MLTSLPTEIVQEIAWLSLNPNLYHVSHSLRKQLVSQHDFAHDLAILLLCDRQTHDSAWLGRSVPWRTPQARHWDLILSQTERQLRQKLVFDLQYMNIARFVSMVRYTLRLWINLYAPFTKSVEPPQQQRLDAYLNTTEDFVNYIRIEDVTGNLLALLNNSKVYVSHARPKLPPHAGYVVYVEYVPTRLLTIEKELGVNTFSRTLLSRTRMDALNHQIVKNRVATAKPKWMEI